MTTSLISWPNKIEEFLDSDLDKIGVNLIKDVSLILLNNIVILLKFINNVEFNHLSYLLRYTEFELFSKSVCKIISSSSFYIRKTRLLEMAHNRGEFGLRVNYGIALINRKKCYSDSILEHISIGAIHKKYSDYKIIKYCASYYAGEDLDEEDSLYLGYGKDVKPFKFIINESDKNKIVGNLIKNGVFNVDSCQLILIARKIGCKFYVTVNYEELYDIPAFRTWPNDYYLAVNLLSYLQLLVRKRKGKNIIMRAGDFIENFIKKILSGFTNCNIQKLILYYI